MKEKDAWDKFEILSRAIAGVFIPLAIFVAGFMLSKADEESSRFSAEAARLTNLIEPLSSTNEKQQLIAVEVASHLAKTRQLPGELVPTLIRLATESKSSETAKAATQALLEVAGQSQSHDTEERVRKALSGVPPRVYFHISSNAQRPRAKETAEALERKLEDLHLSVPGIELRPGPVQTELRFFKATERNEAARIVKVLASLGVSAKLTDLSATYENSKGIRPRHYELWMGRDG